MKYLPLQRITRSRILAIVVSILGLAVSMTVLVSCNAESESDETLHPEFDLKAADLAPMVESLPPSIADGILARPWYFLELVSEVIEMPLAFTVLVDKAHALAADDDPPDLVPLTDYDLLLNRTDLSLRRIIMPDVLAMNEAALIDGVSLVFSSTYRSYDYQKGLYARNVAWYGEEQASRESAKPGESQHQLGTTIDFGSITDAFGETDAGKWLFQHAWEYGFSLSYPDGYEELTGYRHEIWHYRYLGRMATRLEREFFDSVQHHLLTFLHEHRATLEAARINRLEPAR